MRHPAACRLSTLLGLLALLFWPAAAAGQEAAPGEAPSSPSPAELPRGAEPGTSQEIAPPAGWPTFPTAVPAPTGTPEPARRLRFGPDPTPAGEAPLSVKATVTVDGEWTDNADQSKTDRQPEFRTRVAPGVAVGLQRQQTKVDLTYVPRFLLPDGRVNDSTVEHDLTFRGEWKPATRLALNLSEDLVKSSDFRDVPDLGSRRTGQGDFLRNRVTGETAYLLESFRAAVSYTHEMTRDYQLASNDSSAQTGRASLAFTGPQNSLQGSYSLRRGEYQTSIPYWEQQWDLSLSRALSSGLSLNGVGMFTWHTEDQDKGFLIGQAKIGATTALGPTGSLSIQAGASVFEPEAGKTRLTPSGLITLSQRFASLLVTASYEHAFSSRFQELRNSGVSETQSASLFLTSTTFRDLVLSLGGRWNRNRTEQTTTAGGARGTIESTWDIEARLRYALLRNLYLGLAYLMTLRTATDPSDGFLENRIQFGLTYSLSN